MKRIDQYRPSHYKGAEAVTDLIVGYTLHALPSQSQHSASPSSEPFVGLIVVLGHLSVHSLQSFRSTLDRDDGFLSTFRLGNDGDGGHSLKSRRELESTLDMDLGFVSGFVVRLGSNEIA